MSGDRSLRRMVEGASVLLAFVTKTALVGAQAPESPTGAGASAVASEGPSPASESPFPDATRPLAETLTGQAKSDYETALVLHKSGDFAGAERRFLSAYEAAKDVRLLWNAAACEQGLRHYSKAIGLVRRYLSSRSPLITEEAERNARAFLDAALPLTARLLVEGNATGSSAYLDDDLLGTFPLDPETRVDFGSHRLLVKKPQFVDDTQTFTVTSSADVHLALKLLAVVHQGRLVVRAGKGDAIALDGHFRALGTFDGALPSGTHRLRVTAVGSRPFETSVVVEDDRTRALDATLTRSPVAFGIPTWVWLAGGALVLAGAGTATYIITRSPDSASEPLPGGSAGKVQLPLR
jgi:PEGA domain